MCIILVLVQFDLFFFLKFLATAYCVNKRSLGEEERSESPGSPTKKQRSSFDDQDESTLKNDLSKQFSNCEIKDSKPEVGTSSPMIDDTAYFYKKQIARDPTLHSSNLQQKPVTKPIHEKSEMQVHSSVEKSTSTEDPIFHIAEAPVSISPDRGADLSSTIDTLTTAGEALTTLIAVPTAMHIVGSVVDSSLGSQGTRPFRHSCVRRCTSSSRRLYCFAKRDSS